MGVEQIECEEGQGGCMRLHGALDFTTVGAIWSAGNELVGSGKVQQVDLAFVERTDSAGVALLLEWSRIARQAGVDIVFRNAPGQMRAIVRASGVDDVLVMTEQSGDGRASKMG